MILSVTLNAAVDQIFFIEGLKAHDTNRVREVQTDAGGKGINLSRIVGEMGGLSVATGFLAGSTGAYIRSVLDHQGVTHDFVEVPGETRINLSVESGDGPPTTFNQRGPEISAEAWTELKAKLSDRARSAEWVAFGGSLPPGVTPEAFVELGQIARDAGAKVLIDADGEPMRQAMAWGPDLIKPNRAEAERLLGHDLPDRAAEERALAELLQQLREAGSADPTVVLSLGGDGALLGRAEGAWFAPAVSISVRSTIGSGDSLLGGLLASRQRGEDWPTALSWGAAAGAATATTDGTQIGRRADIWALQPQVHVIALGTGIL